MAPGCGANRAVDIKTIQFDPEKRQFQYWVTFKDDAQEGDVRARVSIEVAFSLSETGELADISFTVPKTCRNEQALSFLSKDHNTRLVETRVFISVPNQSGDSVMRAPADLQLDQHGRIVAMEIH